MILKAALFSLLLINLCQAGDDGFNEAKRTEGHQIPVKKADIASQIVEELQAVKPEDRSPFQLLSLNESYSRADWPGFCIMGSLREAIQAGLPEVISAFKDKVNQVRSHKKFDEYENWTFDYLNGIVSAILSGGV